MHASLFAFTYLERSHDLILIASICNKSFALPLAANSIHGFPIPYTVFQLQFASWSDCCTLKFVFFCLLPTIVWNMTGNNLPLKNIPPVLKKDTNFSLFSNAKKFPLGFKGKRNAFKSKHITIDIMRSNNALFKFKYIPKYTFGLGIDMHES